MPRKMQRVIVYIMIGTIVLSGIMMGFVGLGSGL
ncbi:stressosome-associated protein Prli42 [Shouchella shacheensis]|nr:stressosome-associated protein Prli42 [Shouchella shacheensis]